MRHDHNFKFWPFKTSVNTASFTTRQILGGESPVLEVYHDHDGEWQFLCGNTLDVADLKVVCVGCMAEKHPAIFELAKLPVGWCAVRDDVNSAWVIEEYEETEE